MKSPDNYVELLNLEMEMMNILQIRAHELYNEEKVPIIKTLVQKEGTAVNKNSEKETNQQKDCFSMFSEKLKPQHNKTILLL